MPADASMVTMKMLFNNKGVSLVVLLVAITLIAILGTSFVSIMSSKQKAFFHQIDSYRALNIANAGVEYAIRFASDGADTFGFSNPATTTARSLGGGAFSISYTYNQSISNDLLRVIGTYGGSSREVRISRFRRYIKPITLVPDAAPTNRPRFESNDVVVPVITNNENAFFTTRLDVTVNVNNIYLNIEVDGTGVVFDYDSSPYPICGSAPVAVCKDLAQGIFLGAGSIRFDLLSPNHAPDSINVYRLRFSAPPPTGQYALQFYTSLPAGNPFRIEFSL